MNPTQPLGSSLFTIIAIVLGACSAGPDEQPLHRIERIENGMLPAVLVSGEEPIPTSIWETMRHFNVPGVSVAVINDSALEWAKGYGSLEANGPEVNTETLFLAGHMSQAVAAVGVLSLVANGHINLDESVNDRLTSWRIPDNEYTTSEVVTLRHLLTHSSGLTVRSLLGYLPGEPIPTLLQILDGDAPAKNDPIRVTVEPGTGQQYSLGGYVVLQQLLEDVSGQQYSEFINSAVLAPLGMDRSFFAQPLSNDLISNAARGHEPTNEQVQGGWRIYPELAALGMWTTPSDLALLVIELQRAHAGESSRILSQSLAEEMLSSQSELRGLGVDFGGDGDWQFFRLEGHGNNYLTELYAYVAQGMGAVVMTNSANGEGVKAHILRAIAAEYDWPDMLPEEVEAVSLTDHKLRDLEGTYSFRGRDRVLRLERGRLLQTSEGGHDHELRALSDSILVSLMFGYRYGVDREESGAVTGLTLILDGARLFTYEKTN